MVRMTDDQARRRILNVKKTRKKNVYEVVAPVQFKIGELIGLDDIAKVHAPCLFDESATEEEEQEEENKGLEDGK